MHIVLTACKCWTSKSRHIFWGGHNLGKVLWYCRHLQLDMVLCPGNDKLDNNWKKKKKTENSNKSKARLFYFQGPDCITTKTKRTKVNFLHSIVQFCSVNGFVIKTYSGKTKKKQTNYSKVVMSHRFFFFACS